MSLSQKKSRTLVRYYYEILFYLEQFPSYSEHMIKIPFNMFLRIDSFCKFINASSLNKKVFFLLTIPGKNSLTVIQKPNKEVKMAEEGNGHLCVDLDHQQITRRSISFLSPRSHKWSSALLTSGLWSGSDPLGSMGARHNESFRPEHKEGSAQMAKVLCGVPFTSPHISLKLT